MTHAFLFALLKMFETVLLDLPCIQRLQFTIVCLHLPCARYTKSSGIFGSLIRGDAKALALSTPFVSGQYSFFASGGTHVTILELTQFLRGCQVLTHTTTWLSYKRLGTSRLESVSIQNQEKQSCCVLAIGDWAR